MSADFLTAAGLAPVELSDRQTLTPFFDAVATPLSDYTFSQVFTWRNSLRLGWKIIRGHLCVFANGSGDLTLLLPPLGDTGGDAALVEARELMDGYNAAHQVHDRTRVEYVSESMLSRFSGSAFDASPMGGDYIYDVARMIDLAGGDLKSKRQERNRFTRDYAHRVEMYDSARHLNDCLRLLHTWRDAQQSRHASDADASLASVKRQKETLATELALCHATELGLSGMVVYVAGSDGAETIKGFTFGELLGTDQSSIVIEKTDLSVKGLAQFIFSEFCRRHWSHRPFVNAGDDWGVDSLAWTKNSYRPVKRLAKYVLRPKTVAVAAVPETIRENSIVTIRPAEPRDVPKIAAIETRCFDVYRLSERRLRYLAGRESAVVIVAEMDNEVVGETVGLLRHHKNGTTGRVYSLAVDAARRGHGIGRRLIADVLRRLVEQGAKRVFLEVESTNETALTMYRSFGFTPSGQPIPDYYGAGRAAIRMLRDLDATPELPRPLAA